MALTIGTDAYISEVDADSYWSDRGNTDWDASLTKEADIRKATDWINNSFTFVGEKATATQRLQWPREHAYADGFLIASTEIPWQVEEATAIVADLFRQGTFNLDGVITDDESAISMQKVDVITVQYDTSKRLRGKTQLNHVNDLLRSVTMARGQLTRAI